MIHVYSNGEALTFEPVKLESIPNHPLKEYCIIAIATVTQVHVPFSGNHGDDFL